MDALFSPDLEWLAQGLLLSLALGLLLAAGVGVLLLVRPGWAFSLDQNWSRWVDTTGQFKALDRPRSVERLFYRHHRLAGTLITLGAAFVLWQWTFAYERQGLFAVLGERWSRAELSWVVSAGEWAVVSLHVLILVLGAVVAIRPSLLKHLESGGNRWHEARLGAALDRAYHPLERGLQVQPRVAGLFLLAAAGWCLGGLLPVLSRLLN